MNQQSPDGGNLRTLVWLCAGVGWVVALAAGGVFVPVQFRPMGLFLIALGAVAGAGLGVLARWCRVPRTSRTLLFATLLVAGSEMAFMTGSYRLHAASVKRETKQAREKLNEEFANDPTAKFDAQLQEQRHDAKDEADPESAKARQEFRDELDRIGRLRYKRLEEIDQEEVQMGTFQGYLTHRVAPLGAWPFPWPIVFVCGEVLCGSIAGGWAAWESQGRRRQRDRFDPNAAVSI